MRLAATQAVAAPPRAVFERLADFEGFEARARARRMPVERLSDDPPVWRIGVEWHGLCYSVALRIVAIRPPEGFEAALASRGVEGQARIAVTAAPGGSRLSVQVTVAGHGLGGRLALQTLGFARAALEARLGGALARLAAEIEAGAALPSAGS